MKNNDNSTDDDKSCSEQDKSFRGRARKKLIKYTSPQSRSVLKQKSKPNGGDTKRGTDDCDDSDSSSVGGNLSISSLSSDEELHQSKMKKKGRKENGSRSSGKDSKKKKRRTSSSRKDDSASEVCIQALN